MTTFAQTEKILSDSLNLTRRPVAVILCDQAPDGVTKFTGTLPSGCSFWRLAAEGRVFYTVPADHYNCPVGSYTHNMPMPKDREPELMQTLTLMTQVGYIRMEEVPSIPQLPSTPAAIVYAPLGETPADPDTVIVAGHPGHLMLLHEAALRSGVDVTPLFGRPTCSVIPVTKNHGLVSSVGCIGNRVYTDLPDEELYTAIAGTAVGPVAEQLAVIVAANAALADHHARRRESLTG